MLVLSSSARRMRTLSVYNGSRQGMSKNSQHFSPTTSKSCFIVVLAFILFFFVKGVKGVWPSLNVPFVSTGSVLLQRYWRRKWVGSFWTDFPSQCRAQRLLHRNQGRFEFSQVCACNTWVGINMQMFYFDVTLKRLKISFKTTRFHDSESTLSFERQKRYTLCTYRFQTLQDVFIH